MKSRNWKKKKKICAKEEEEGEIEFNRKHIRHQTSDMGTLDIQYSDICVYCEKRQEYRSIQMIFCHDGKQILLQICKTW